MLSCESVEEQHRDVYCHFGAAAARASEFEMVLTNILLLNAKRSGKVTTVEDFDALDAKLRESKKTLGNLLKEVKLGTTLPGRTLGALGQALDCRNYLIHHFFRDKAFEFETEEGRTRLVNELREARDYIVVATRLANDLVQSMARDFGITPEAVQAEAEALRERARKVDR
jgi:hypothetical protein